MSYIVLPKHFQKPMGSWHFFTHQPFPDPTPPYPNPPLFLSCKLTRPVNQNRVVTEPKQPGVHNYRGKRKKFCGRQNNSLSLKA